MGKVRDLDKGKKREEVWKEEHQKDKDNKEKCIEGTTEGQERRVQWGNESSLSMLKFVKLFICCGQSVIETIFDSDSFLNNRRIKSNIF